MSGEGWLGRSLFVASRAPLLLLAQHDRCDAAPETPHGTWQSPSPPLALLAVGVFFLRRPAPSEALTQTATSANGKVRAHYPEGFRVVPQKSPGLVKLVRTVSDREEVLSVAVMAEQSKASVAEQSEALWREMLASDPKFQRASQRGRHLGRAFPSSSTT